MLTVLVLVLVVVVMVVVVVVMVVIVLVLVLVSRSWFCVSDVWRLRAPRATTNAVVSSQGLRNSIPH